MAITNETIKDGLKTVFDGTGLGGEFYTHNPVYGADFTTGAGLGTIVLELKLAGDFVEYASVTADTIATLVATGDKALVCRWNCTAFTSGLIVAYLQ